MFAILRLYLTAPSLLKWSDVEFEMRACSGDCLKQHVH